MYICRVIGKEAVSASPQGLLQRTLGRAAEEARWRIKDARKGARGWKARGSRNWRVARETGGWLAKLAGGWRKYAPEMLFAEHEGSGGSLGLWGSLRLWGSLKLFLEGALGLGGLYGSFWGLWGSAGFVRAQGGIALRFPFPFTDLL